MRKLMVTLTAMVAAAVIFLAAVGDARADAASKDASKMSKPKTQETIGSATGGAGAGKIKNQGVGGVPVPPPTKR